MGSRDLRRFVIAVARAASQSEQLLEIVRDCAAALSTPSDEEVHRIVHYCLCLHLITQELAASPECASAQGLAPPREPVSPEATRRQILGLDLRAWFQARAPRTRAPAGRAPLGARLVEASLSF